MGKEEATFDAQLHKLEVVSDGPDGTLGKLGHCKESL